MTESGSSSEDELEDGFAAIQLLGNSIDPERIRVPPPTLATEADAEESYFEEINEYAAWRLASEPKDMQSCKYPITRSAHVTGL